MTHRLSFIAALVSSSILAGCGAIAVQMAPAKVASKERTPAAVKADALFWNTLHEGRYEGIPLALKAMTGRLPSRH